MKHEKHGFGGACLAVAGVLAFAAPSWAAAQQAAPVAATPSAGQSAGALAPKPLDELDEVLVQGGRLYERIVKAEDRFFKLYNELNKDDDFDINCAMLPIEDDSRIEQRFCMPSFFADARAEQVRLRQYCLSLIEKDEEGQIVSQGTCYEPPPAELIFMDRREAYLDAVIEVTNKDPRLRMMANELNALHRERDSLSKKYDEIKATNVSTNSEKHIYRPAIR